MSKPTLALKSTVTRRSPLAAELVDAAERVKQSEHHQAAVLAANAVTTAAQAEPAVSKPKLNPHTLQCAFMAGNLNKTVTVFLTSSVRLSGKLRQFDQYCLLIESENQQQLVFKSVVSTVITASR